MISTETKPARAETLEWIEGSGFAAFLVEQGVTGAELRTKGLDRRFRDWCRGIPASVWTADRVLTQLGLHLSMLPETLYRGPANGETP